MKRVILLLACLLALCQLISCNMVSVTRGIGGLIGSQYETSQSLSPRYSSEATSSIIPPSTIQSTTTRSVKACTCANCLSDTDINRNIYSFNTTCQDSRNFAGIAFNLGSDNTQEMYQVYNVKNDQYKSLIANLPFSYLNSMYANCISQGTQLYNSPSVITAYYCDSQIANATTCSSKYKHSGACYIGLNSINATSNFDSSKLKINIDLIGNDGKLWTRSTSNIKVSVKGTTYSDSFSATNSYMGSIVFTFPVPTTSDTYTISIEAENYFGVVTKDLVQTSARSCASVLKFGGAVAIMIASLVISLLI